MSELQQFIEMLFPMPAMRLVFVAGVVLGFVGAVEWLVHRRFGIIFGIPVKVIHEHYEGQLRDPQQVDVDEHLHEVAHVKWLSSRRLLLLPLRSSNASATVTTSGSSSSTRARGGWMFVGDLVIGGDVREVTFHCRVLLRLVPLLGMVSFVVMPYLELPWGMGILAPWQSPSVDSFFPLVLFGGFLVWTIIQARTSVLVAFHSVTAVLVAARDPRA